MKEVFNKSQNDSGKVKDVPLVGTEDSKSIHVSNNIFINESLILNRKKMSVRVNKQEKIVRASK
jgi:hypothetical protein